jgi:hypothetical protein
MVNYAPIQLDGTVEGDFVPVVDDRDWETILRARSDFRRWIRGAPEGVTQVSGRVSEVLDLSNPTTTPLFTQATAALRPVLSNPDVELSSALTFAVTNRMTRVAELVDFTKAYTMAAIFRPTNKESAEAYRVIAGAQDGTTNRHGILGVRRNQTDPVGSTATVTFGQGNGSINSLGHAWDAMHLAIASFDGASQLDLDVDNLAATPITVTSALATSAYQLGFLQAGYGWAGEIFDLVYFQAGKSTQLYAQIKNLAKSVWPALPFTAPDVPA